MTILFEIGVACFCVTGLLILVIGGLMPHSADIDIERELRDEKEDEE
jgi:hypothetical protein